MSLRLRDGFLAKEEGVEVRVYLPGREEKRAGRAESGQCVLWGWPAQSGSCMTRVGGNVGRTAAKGAPP